MLRLPDGMRDRIAEAAKAANRSMNAEIVARLEASFEERVLGMDAKQADEMLVLLLRRLRGLPTDALKHLIQDP